MWSNNILQDKEHSIQSFAAGCCFMVSHKLCNLAATANPATTAIIAAMQSF